MGEEKLVGRITHYFTRISVAVVELSDTLRVGDEIIIKGATTNLRQKVESMQIMHEPVTEAQAGQSVGLKVVDRVREGDKVYKVVEQ